MCKRVSGKVRMIPECSAQKKEKKERKEKKMTLSRHAAASVGESGGGTWLLLTLTPVHKVRLDIAGVFKSFRRAMED
jgi:hypothetical protein